MSNKLIITTCSFLLFISIYCKAQDNNTDDWITFEYAVTTIASIENNNLLRKRFRFDFEPYEKLKDTITFETAEALKKNITIYLDKLCYKSAAEYSTKYKKLEKYDQAKFKKRLEKLLLQNNYFVEDFYPYSNNEKIQLDFLEVGIFVTQGLKHKYSINQFWEIDTYKNELFLVFDSGLVFQIQNITDNKINVVLYKQENRVITLTKTKYSSKFDLGLLNGVWKEVKIIDSEAPKVPPIPENYRKEEELIINSKYVIRKYEDKTIKIRWLTNKSSDRIIFLEKWDRTSERQWKIKRLTEKELVLIRMNELENRLTEIKFVKI